MKGRGQDQEGEAGGGEIARNPPPPPPTRRSTPPLPTPNRPSQAPSPRERYQVQQQEQNPNVPTQTTAPAPHFSPMPHGGNQNVPTTNPSLPHPPPPPAICNRPWILKIRHPTKGVLRIHVPKGMTAYLLSKCIIQATDVDDEAIVGLFGYHNGMFVSLEHLLSCSNETMPGEDAKTLQQQVYSLSVPEERKHDKIPWWENPQIILGVLAMVLGILWLQQHLVLGLISGIPMALETVWDYLMYFLPRMYHGLVTRPLQDTYRYGPSFMGGWEGASLTNICARMTYGDEEFWKRNLQDCENMYEAKESAFLFVGRPLVFLVLLLALVWIVKQWLWYHELQQRDRYQDRDMVQTYRAMQVLFRQLSRMAGTTDRGHRHQARDYNDR